MSDEAARIFERERRHRNLTVAEYIAYLISEDPSATTLRSSLEEATPWNWVPIKHWSELEHSVLWDDGFQTVSYGDAALTLVGPQQLMAEIIDWGCGQGEGCNMSGVRDNAHPSCPPIVPPGWRVVERCGICEQFDDDLEAANAVSQEAHWVECNAGFEHVVARGTTAFGQGIYMPTGDLAPLISELQDLVEKNILIAL